MRIIFTAEAYHSLCSKYCIDVKKRNPRNRSGVSACWLYLVVYNDHSVNSQFSGFPTIFLFPFVNENSNGLWVNVEILANSFGDLLYKSPLLLDGPSFVRFNNNCRHIFLLSFLVPRCVLFPCPEPPSVSLRQSLNLFPAIGKINSLPVKRAVASEEGRPDSSPMRGNDR